MAVVGNLVARLALDSAEFSAGLNNATRQLTNAGLAMNRLGSDLTKVVTLPIVAAGAAALKFGADFESEMTKIVTLVGVNRDQVKAWEKDILALGRATGKGPDELARAMFVVTSSGERGANALKILESAAQASAIGLGDTAEIARSVTAAMQAYGSEALSAERATEILVATVREGNLKASDLAGSLGRVIGIASQVGVSFDQLGGFVATFTRLGVSAEESVIALRGILTTLLKPTKQSQEALAQVGLSAADLRAQIAEKGLARTLVDLVAAFEGNDEALAKVIPNVRALAGVLGTAGAQAEQFVDITDKVTNSQEILAKGLEEAQKTLAFMWSQIRADLHATAVEFGTVLLPIVKDSVVPALQALAKTLAEAVKAFAALPAPVQKVVIAVAALVAAVGPLLILGSKLIFMYKNVLVLLGQIIPFLAGTAKATTAAGTAAGATAAKVGLLGAAAAKLGIAFKAVSAVLVGPWGIAIAAAVAGIILYKDEIADLIVRFTDWIGLTESSNKILRDTGFATSEASAGFKNVAHSIGIGVAGLKELTAENSLAIDALGMNRAAVDKLKQAMLDGKITVADYQNELRRLIALETEKKIAEIKREFADARQEFAAGRITLEELGQIVGRNNDLYAKWVDRIQDVKKANSEAVEQARKDLSFYQKFLLDIAKLPEVSGIKQGILGRIDPGGLAGAANADEVAANLQKLSEAAREAAESGRVVGAVFAEAAQPIAQVGAESENTTPKVSAMAAGASKAADKFGQLAQSVRDSLTPVSNLQTELAELTSRGFTPAQLAAAGYAEKAAAAVAEQKRVNEALGVTTQVLPPLIAKLLELASAQKQASDWAKILGKDLQDLSGSVLGARRAMTDLASTVPPNTRGFAEFSAGALKARQDLREMEAGVRATEQKVRDFIEAGASSSQMLHALSSDIVRAVETAKALGIEVDESTMALYRQIKGAEASSAASKQWDNAWSTAVGNIVSRFTQMVVDLDFRWKSLKDSLISTTKGLVKSMIEIFITGLFSPLAKLMNSFGGIVSGFLGKMLGGLFGFGGKAAGTAAAGAIGSVASAAAGAVGAGAAATGSAIGASAGAGVAAGGAGAAAGAGTAAGGGGLGIASAGAGMAAAVKGAAVFLATNPVGWAILGGLGVFAGFKLLKKSPEEKISSELSRDFAGISAGKGDVKQIIASLNISKKASEGIRKEISTLIALQQGFGAGATAQTQQAVFAALSRFQVSAAVGQKALAAGVPGMQIGKDIVFDLSAAVQQAFQGVTGPLIEQLTMILGGSERFAQALPNFAAIIAGLIGPGSQAQHAADQFAMAGTAAQESSAKTLEGLEAVGAIAESFPGFAEKIKDQVQAALQPPQAGGSPIHPDSLVVSGAVAGILPQSMLDSLKEQVAAAINSFSAVGTDAAFAADQFTQTAAAAVGAGEQSQAFLAEMGSGLDGVRDRFASGIEDVLANLGNLLDGLSEKLDALHERQGIEAQAAASGNGKSVTVQIYGGDRKEVLKTVQQAMNTNEDGFGEQFIYDFNRQQGGF